MGRKNLLDGLMSPASADRIVADGVIPEDARPSGVRVEDVAPAREAASSREASRRRGAVGAVSRSIADLRARAVVDLDPHTIEEDGPQDRLEEDSDEEARLVASIREHGQQVPVLVRPHPERAERWRIVYGRRRVLAAREIGIPVKALVRDLDDHAAVLAQGQENTHRRDLSFIERANFARQLRDLGYGRPAIAEAVNVDKTLLSRFLSVADRVPVAVIHAIGAAPMIGRERWLAFADLCAGADWEPATMAALAVEKTGQGADDRPRHATSSDARFEALFRTLSRAAERSAPREGEMSLAPSSPVRTATPQTQTVTTREGVQLAVVKRSSRQLTLAFRTRSDAGNADAFAEWLLSELPELHRRWCESDREADND